MSGLWPRTVRSAWSMSPASASDRPAGLGLKHATEAATDDLMVIDEDEPEAVGFGHPHSQLGYGRRGKAGPLPRGSPPEVHAGPS